MLQSLMSPLALNQPGLDPFSVGSVSSLSSPTTTLSPGNYLIYKEHISHLGVFFAPRVNTFMGVLNKV